MPGFNEREAQEAEAQYKRLMAEAEGQTPPSSQTVQQYAPPAPVPAPNQQPAATRLDPEIEQFLSEAQRAGNHLVIICYVAGGTMQYRRKTSQFPHSFFPNVLDESKKDLEKEIGPPVPEQPMQVAQPLPPMFDPYGQK